MERCAEVLAGLQGLIKVSECIQEVWHMDQPGPTDGAVCEGVGWLAGADQTRQIECCMEVPAGLQGLIKPHIAYEMWSGHGSVNTCMYGCVEESNAIMHRCGSFEHAGDDESRQGWV
eukprot:scaffold143351_cov22-Tisochrysis_lutea.AAC.4